MQFCSLRSLPAIPAHVRTCSHPIQTSGKSLRGRRSRPQVFLHLPSRFCPQADKLQSQLHFSELVMKRKNHFSIRKSRTAAQILEQSVSCPDECLGEIKLSSQLAGNHITHYQKAVACLDFIQTHQLNSHDLQDCRKLHRYFFHHPLAFRFKYNTECKTEKLGRQFTLLILNQRKKKSIFCTLEGKKKIILFLYLKC